MLGLPEEFTPEFIGRLEHLRIKTRREYAGLGKGTHLSPRRGSSLEFSDFRHYAMGDPERDRKFKIAVATALSVAYVALASGDRVMIRVLGGRGTAPPPAFVNGRHRIVELARNLNTIRPDGEVDLAPAMAREMISLKRAGKVFLISDFLMLINSV